MKDKESLDNDQSQARKLMHDLIRGAKDRFMKIT